MYMPPPYISPLEPPWPTPALLRRPEDDDDDDDDEAHDEDEENAEDAAYSLARFVEAQAYAAYLAAATGPKAPAAYDVFIAAQAATEAARIVRRDAKLRGAL